MKRRTFVSTLAALLATPALPVSASAPLATAGISQHFAKAKLLARCHDRASPEMFARLMKLDTKTAQGVFDMLQQRSVIAQGLDGVTRAVNPLNTHCVPNEAIKARDLAQMTRDVASRIQKLVSDQKPETEHSDVMVDLTEDENDALADPTTPAPEGYTTG